MSSKSDEKILKSIGVDAGKIDNALVPYTANLALKMMNHNAYANPE